MNNEKKKDFWTIFLFLLVIALIPSVSATDRYFCGNGSDASSTCNITNPCASLARLEALSRSAGDTANFCGGNIFRGKLTIGTDNFTMQSYGTGKAKLWGSENYSASGNWTYNGSNKYVSVGTFGSPIYQMYHNVNVNATPGYRSTTAAGLDTNWEFFYNTTTGKVWVYLSTGNPGTIGQGIEIPSYNQTYSQAMIWVDNGNNQIWQNLEIGFTRYMGLGFYQGSGMIIRNMDFKYVYEKAVSTDLGSNVIIDNNTYYFSGVRGQAAPIGQGAMGENIWVSRCDNCNTTRNTVQKCGGVCINFWHTDGDYAAYNKVFDSAMDPTDWSGGLYWDGCQNFLAEYNNVTDSQIGLAVGNEISGYNSSNFLFRYNILARNVIADIVIDGSPAAIEVYNGTIDHTTSYKPVHYGGSGFGNQIFIQHHNGINFTNNLVYNDYTNTTAGYLIFAQNGTNGLNYYGDYNSFNSTNRQDFLYASTTYTTLAGWQTRTSQDSHSITVNPQFVDAANNDFRPAQGNPVCTASSTGSYIGALPCAGDLTPPGNVSGIARTSYNYTWILLNWTNPADADFNHTEIYRNGTFVVNSTGTGYNFTGLTNSSSYIFTWIAVDNAGLKGSNVTFTTSTDTPPYVPPSSGPKKAVNGKLTIKLSGKFILK